MIFSSIFFLCIFLPVTLIVYYLVPWKAKNPVLLAASLVFYAWGEPVYILLMMFSIVFNYLGGIQMEGCAITGRNRRRKAVFLFTICMDIAVLCFFKYYGFLVANLNAWFHSDIPIRNLPLPIGISFYTFQILSYVIDVYRKRVPAQRNLISFGTYVTMFPQLIAGPIVRYADIEQQLKTRVLSLTQIADGAVWFVRGLAKKVLLANNIGMLFDSIYAIPAAQRPVLTAWLGIIAYTFQIYFDFSGYSDMAIGLGKMLGFRFVKNFDYPYISGSVTEFWRRWHISLGTWFREYVYIPMGGNRVGTLKHIRNIMVVWLLTGFWHGAEWTFVLWGVYYGILLLLEKYILKPIFYGRWKALKHVYTMVLVIFGWLIFTAPTLADLGVNASALFGGQGNGFADPATGYYFLSNLVLLLICAVASTPYPHRFLKKLYQTGSLFGKVVPTVYYLAIFLLSFGYLVNATYNPFLYFKF